MIYYELNRKDYKKLDLKMEGLSIKQISGFIHLLPLIEDIEKLINYFNQEYKWDDMFNIEDVKERIYKNHLFYLLYLDKNPIGYFFIEPAIDNRSAYLYNLYVTNVTTRPDLSPVWFVNNSLKMIFARGIFEEIECKCEIWNKSAQEVFIKNNFSEKNKI